MLVFYIGYFMDIILGDPYWMPHPVRYIGKIIEKTEKIIRIFFSNVKNLKFAGVILGTIVISVTFLFYFFLLEIFLKNTIILKKILEIIIIYQIFATRCLGDEGYKIYKSLKDGKIDLSRKQISYLVSRDTENLDEENIVKATVETITENITDGIISPMFYLVIGGIPLAMAYKATNTLDSMVGYKNEKYIDLGWFSAKFDDLLNYIPARISGVFVIVSAFILGLDYKNSIKIMLRDCKNHSSPNSGYSESASAGALKIQLGGKASYFGVSSMKPTMGDYIEKPNSDHIIKAIKIMYMTSFLGLVVFSTRYLV